MNETDHVFWEMICLEFPLIGRAAWKFWASGDDIPEDDLQLFADWLGDRSLF